MNLRMSLKSTDIGSDTMGLTVGEPKEERRQNNDV